MTAFKPACRKVSSLCVNMHTYNYISTIITTCYVQYAFVSVYIHECIYTYMKCRGQVAAAKRSSSLPTELQSYSALTRVWGLQ